MSREYVYVGQIEAIHANLMFPFPLLFTQADCLSATYTLDDSVFVAIDELKPVACPLSGGYQILMHRSDSISKERKCLENAPSYRPHLQFQCDQVGSSHVLADFGPHCTLMELQKSGPMMGKYMAHLDCVDSWQENSGTSKQSTSVLMRMQGSNLSLWCLHLKRLPNSAHSSVTSEEESLYQAYLSVDGSCSPDVQGQGSVPTAFEMFGKLASFIPGDDIKCQEASYLHECESQAISKCQESTDCPKTCGRCLGEKTTTSTCSMPSTVLGTWESFPHGEGHIITVHGDSVKTSSQGDFKCWSTHKDMFSLVQTGKHSTCMPYHACTRIERLAPGLIIYEMFPANRKKDSGEVQSCKQTRESNERFNKGTFSSTTTLMQPQKLHETPCNIEGKIISEVMNMEPQCNLVIHECSGSCTTFNISIDEGTCGNKTAEEAGLLTQHTCLAVLPGGEINMVLTRSPDNDQYLCWVKLSTMFFALSPDKCNKDQIDAVMRIVNPDDVPNTFSLLKRRPPTIEKDPEKDGSAQAKLSITAFALAFLILALTNL